MTLLTSPFHSLHENDILLLQSKAIIFVNFDTTFRVLDFYSLQCTTFSIQDIIRPLLLKAKTITPSEKTEKYNIQKQKIFFLFFFNFLPNFARHLEKYSQNLVFSVSFTSQIDSQNVLAIF